VPGTISVPVRLLALRSRLAGSFTASFHTGSEVVPDTCLKQLQDQFEDHGQDCASQRQIAQALGELEKFLDRILLLEIRDTRLLNIRT